MRIGSLAALAISITLASTVWAQENYTIRPTYHSNLRTEPSLQAEVFELVEPEIPLLVVGESGDWLELTRFGKTAYMANWIPYTVVGHGEGLTIETEFADISCRSDVPFDDHAGQRHYNHGQICSVTRIWEFDPSPAETVTDVETDTTTENIKATPTPPDIEQDVELGGLETVAEQVGASLIKLHEISPDWYAYVVEVVDKIIGFGDSPSDPNYRHSAAYVYAHTGAVYVSEYAALEGFGSWERDVGVAVMLIHEACHVHQYIDKVVLPQPDEEIMCDVIAMNAIEGLQSSEVRGHLEGKIVVTLYHQGQA